MQNLQTEDCLLYTYFLQFMVEDLIFCSDIIPIHSIFCQKIQYHMQIEYCNRTNRDTKLNSSF